MKRKSRRCSVSSGVLSKLHRWFVIWGQREFRRLQKACRFAHAAAFAKIGLKCDNGKRETDVADGWKLRCLSADCANNFQFICDTENDK